MRKLVIKIGTKFNRLRIVKELPIRISKSGKRDRIFLCECICENTLTVRLRNLRNNSISSCGCYRREMKSLRSRTHGLYKHPLYNTYRSMLNRCYSIKNPRYKDYGGRGIKVCKEWSNKTNGLQNFIGWAENNSYKKGLEIDRKNNNLGYCPGNCRWVTNIVQSRNKRNNHTIKVRGSVQAFADYYDNYKGKKTTYKIAYNRYREGWSALKAISTPRIECMVRSKKKFKFFLNAARDAGISV